ncbi:MAG: hypothetical protein BJ554DRAFT_8308 [Olpidium bornovanus]|uniref:Uncharacterized protein n=1 Tax=Olpidium bornovanus TaxID=278681 RepID=A0A8H7ZUJ1_9FUNG|nr:MAG: hypothetical protein BJ554DRAFT_8308 [Olpidium bornovanus]
MELPLLYYVKTERTEAAGVTDSIVVFNSVRQARSLRIAIGLRVLQHSRNGTTWVSSRAGLSSQTSAYLNWSYKRTVDGMTH